MQNLPLIALTVSTIALFVGFLNYRRKSSISIHGNFQINSSIDCNDKYVNKVILENKKDRSVAIYKIYLRIYPNSYIVLSEFDNSPLIIKPFEVHQIEYGPIQYYGINMNKIEINHLLDMKKRSYRKKIRLVLSTSTGKYTVKKCIKYWDPIIDFFKNYSTAIIRPSIVRYKEQFIGSNIKFVIILKYKDAEQAIQLREDDYQIKIFKDFNFTKESLENKDTLKKYLEELLKSGVLKCESFEILDTSSWKEEHIKTIKAPDLNAFQYYVLGKIASIASNIQTKKHNKVIQKKV